MRKCKREWENPIDNVLIDLCECVCPFLHSVGWTPNLITLVGLIVSLYSVVCLCTGRVYWFAVLFLLGYWFDCLDGHFARKYKMETTVGDYFDHIRDIVVFILVVVVMLYRYADLILKPSPLAVLFWSIWGIYLWNMVQYVGCLENTQHTYRPHSPTLNWMKSFCPSRHPSTIRRLRYFGQGTFICIFILLVLVLENTNKSEV